MRRSASDSKLSDRPHADSLERIIKRRLVQVHLRGESYRDSDIIIHRQCNQEASCECRVAQPTWEKHGTNSTEEGSGSKEHDKIAMIRNGLPAGRIARVVRISKTEQLVAVLGSRERRI